VATSATNYAVYGELGRLPLSISRKLCVVKYWLRLILLRNIPVYLREAYWLAIQGTELKMVLQYNKDS